MRDLFEIPRIMGDGSPFWKMEDPLVVDGKIVRGGMFPHQREWWKLPNFIKLLVGGYGAGKTIIGCKRIIGSSLDNTGCPVAAVSPTFPMARTTVIATIASLLEGKKTIYPKEFHWKYNTTTHEFQVRFHGRKGIIYVYSGEKPHLLKGPNLAAAYIDEPFIQEEEVFHQMIARVRHPGAVKLEITLTGTPENLGWGYDLCKGDLAEKHDVGVVHAGSYDNFLLPPGYVNRLEASFSGRAADAFIKGLFVNLSTGQVYYAFDPSVNVIDLPFPEGCELGAGMDFNVNPMASAAFWKHGNHIHFFDEIELENADTEFMCSTLKERYGSPAPNRRSVLHTIYPDATGSARKTASPSGKSDFSYIREAGFSIRARHENPKRRDRYNAVNGKLKSASGNVTLTISPKCKKIIKYMSTHTYEDMRKQEQMTHLLSAVGYPVEYLFPVSRDTISVYKLIGV